MSLIGKEPRLIIDFEMYKGTEDSSEKDEGELTVAKRMLSKVAKDHKHTIDVVVYDALACNSIWNKHCLKSKVIPVIHVKDSEQEIVNRFIQLSEFQQLASLGITMGVINSFLFPQYTPILLPSPVPLQIGIVLIMPPSGAVKELLLLLVGTSEEELEKSDVYLTAKIATEFIATVVTLGTGFTVLFDGTKRLLPDVKRIITTGRTGVAIAGVPGGLVSLGGSITVDLVEVEIAAKEISVGLLFAAASVNAGKSCFKDFNILQEAGNAFNKEVLEAMKNPNYKKYKVDCSEIAEHLYKVSGKEGKIYRIVGKGEGGWMRGYEYGEIRSYLYHEVYSDGYYIFDPRYSDLPILKDDYFKALREINPGGFHVNELP